MSLSMSMSSCISDLRLRVGGVRSFSPNCTTGWIMMSHMPMPISLPTPIHLNNKTSSIIPNRTSTSIIRCEVAAAEVSTSSPDDQEQEESKIGARVKVKVPLKVYHIPKVAEFDLTGLEGEIKQYVALWKGKRISANFPYKVQFLTDIQGRPVKFFAHLKEDEFHYL
ncbi:hypothetical protein TanjilG_04107 [Lupinus angustifolius]|uniref:Ferredoxin thioredoxin reductase alpha chain domain-containing protein n=1 Tax=Lupinus angustifolius TaxID=3871 RepID=A0A1J7HHR2_LUPAN|nr:PREDICTED: ferredoxin-thioredoxin reductase, variable chain-like [Lupinus angustifolius]XP_019442496.1 PREDICTED: ferredoxin-thioredoxin reductase, variable chain-like [Lupinus angustifolius]OIV94180.1 hypothetical protein TanjilG_13797 [Lupinus angustifolius]OIW12358.1 hypothetical protein TanjilG_04107 [Lupinus angustifolius]